MDTTTDGRLGVQARARDETPIERLAGLRETLLGGRGPGASAEEVAGHTRDRPWLTARPAPAERALVDGIRLHHLGSGEPTVNRRVREGEPRRVSRAVFVRGAAVGAAAALVLRTITVRLTRARGNHLT
ncbi:MAG: hypothetical protein ABI746_13470 [Dermatophilaceae bacterium]